MSDAAAPHICENLECKVHEKGTCVEGLDLDKCPHYGKEPQKPETDEGAESSRGVALPAGVKLTIAEVTRLLRAAESRVIAMIGPSEAGKTSLIASLYDLYQMGPVSGTSFRRSLTLYELEQTCHDARAASQRGEPHFNRTPRGEVQFYHFDLKGGPAGDGITLALADRGGEEYQDAMEDVSLAEEFVEIRRADTLSVLVDGERLLNNGARHNLKAEIRIIIAALIEGGAIVNKPQLALVLTKVDVLEGAAEKARAEADFMEVREGLETEFGTHFGVCQIFRVAASSKNEDVPRGTGVGEVLAFWLGERASVPTEPPDIPPAARLFGQFGEQEIEV